MSMKTVIAACAASLVVGAGAFVSPSSAQPGHHTKDYAQGRARERAEKAAYYAQGRAKERAERAAYYAQGRAKERAEKAAYYASLRHNKK